MSHETLEYKRNRRPGSASGRAGASPTLAQKAKATLRHVRFSSANRSDVVRFSPRLSGVPRRALEFWIRRLPATFYSLLPPVKLAVADELAAVGGNVFINETPSRESQDRPSRTHAVSFIPERYIVLDAALFRRRIELGRILYHEFCHFVWPRLGNAKRRRFQVLLQMEMRKRVRGELGYSAELRKAGIGSGRKAGQSRSARQREKLDYFCESFCDTGSFVLQGDERRKRHSEHTLSRAARERRCRVWSEIVMEV